MYIDLPLNLNICMYELLNAILEAKWCHFLRTLLHEFVIFACKWYYSRCFFPFHQVNMHKFQYIKCYKVLGIQKYLHSRKARTGIYKLNWQLDATESVSHFKQLFHDLITCCYSRCWKTFGKSCKMTKRIEYVQINFTIESILSWDLLLLPLQPMTILLILVVFYSKFLKLKQI